MKLIIALALALAPAVASADEHDMSKMNHKKEDSTRKVDSKNPDQLMTDARIASILHKVNKSEIDAGKLAEKNGISQDVKDYGRMLIKDHQMADEKLASIAKKANIDLDKLNGPDKEMLETNERKMDQVKKMKGAEFDRAFGVAMADGHEGVLKMLSDHGKDIKTAELKQFVDDTTPTLQHHKEMAEKIGNKSPAAQGRAPEAQPRKY